ncbi:MAG: aminomethyltransferase family protein [Acidimicrobiia bacterium]|nr:aminomethyltransferase family protein [Acidimicrobiia bacterium]
MLRHTPFHSRVAAANQTSLWSHWSGHLVAEQYQASARWEHAAIRNAVGIFDASPLRKYRITGPGAEGFLGRLLARDVRRCTPGQAQYTVWCDDRGFVDDDGVVFRLGPEEFLLTAYDPNLALLTERAGSFPATAGRVAIEEVSDELGILAVQGPRSHAVLAALAGPELARLRPFELLATPIGGAEVTISRTGFTGDLGYEVICAAGDAPDVWDRVSEAGRPHGLVPFGQVALLIARIEAGLLLYRVDFQSARRAENDEQRSTPRELGLGWMLAGIDDDSRPFVGRRALLRERYEGRSRWVMMGLALDQLEYDMRHHEAGVTPPYAFQPVHTEALVYDGDGPGVGYTCSFVYSPTLQRHIALARLRPEAAVPGRRVALEFTINHRYVRIGATVARNPLFDPPRRKAVPAPLPPEVAP